MICKNPPLMLPLGNLPHGNIADKTLLIFYLRYLGLVYVVRCGDPPAPTPPAPQASPLPPTNSKQRTLN